ncbi:MAG: phage baseplate assembly protein V [Alphaproteobacteria bacterium]|nr:phage baseplate assembly protein V [Alphaproteobacteria bacterium]MDD9919786.1 phage baseplate assembly protein V [Alphaproteobacteria bacterium]
MNRAFYKLLLPLKNRISNMLRRFVLENANDGTKMQSVKVKGRADEILENCERFQNYGLTSVPHAGAEAIALSLSGNQSHTVVIAVDDRRYRLKGLAKGEVALYTDEGDTIHLKRGNAMDINTGTLTINASTKVQINSPLVETSDKIKAGNDIQAIGDIQDLMNSGGKTMGSMRSTYNSHKHPENDNGGPTSVPNEQM